MQGHLWNEELNVVVETQCAHCQQPMRLEIDHDANLLSSDPESDPRIFIPEVDIGALEAPNIIEDF